MIELLNGDCLDVMKDIKTGSVDLILTDPPYGTIKGMELKGWNKKDTSWDVKVDTEELFLQFERILRPNGKLIIFSQQPYTTELINNQTDSLIFCYDLIWNKINHANHFCVNKKPLNVFEMISVFTNRYDKFCVNELRAISKEIYEKNNIKNKKEIFKKMGNQSMCHFFRFDTPQFKLCTEVAWNEFCKHYDSCGYSYKELKSINEKYGNIYNLIDGKSEKTILSFPKDKENVHPTQKPVSLLKHLIKMYSNENDVILDCFMGSGSTGIASIETNRSFIGIEKSDYYFQISKDKILKTIEKSTEK